MTHTVTHTVTHTHTLTSELREPLDDLTPPLMGVLLWRGLLRNIVESWPGPGPTSDISDSKCIIMQVCNMQALIMCNGTHNHQLPQGTFKCKTKKSSAQWSFLRWIVRKGLFLENRWMLGPTGIWQTHHEQYTNRSLFKSLNTLNGTLSQKLQLPIKAKLS